MAMPSTEPLPAHLAAYLYRGGESEVLEFMQTLDWTVAKNRLELVQTFMAMSNNRNGGAVVIGMRENSDGTYTREGMSQDDYASFDPDHVPAQSARYTDPALTMRAVKGRHEGLLFVVIEIGPSTEVPTVCKQAHGGSGILREGAIYVRPPGTPRTEQVHTYQDMRAIIDQAVERRIERFRELGLLPAMGAEATPGDREALDTEIEDLS